jgi:hypothetical protein
VAMRVLASAYMVLTRLEPMLDSVRFETRHSGLLVVRKDGELLSMDFPALFPEGLRKSAGATDLRSRTGPLASKVLEVNDTCIAVYEDESTIQTMQPDFARLEQLHPFALSVTAPGTGILFRAISSRVTVCPKIRQTVPWTAP